jgi:flagellar motor switch protein FliN/FliY
LKIENALESEFMNVMSVTLAKELLQGFGLGNEEEEAVETSAPDPVPAPEAGSGRKMSQEEIEQLMAKMAGGNEPAPAPVADPAPEAGSGRKMSQEEIEQLMAKMAGENEPASESGGDSKMSGEVERMMSDMADGNNSVPAQESVQQPVATPPMPAQQPMAAAPDMAQGQQPPMMPYGYPPADGNPYGYMYPPMYYPGYPYPPQQPAAPAVPPEPKVIATKPVPMQEMETQMPLGKEQKENLDLIMEVPLQVTVEIGRTKRKVQDILEFSKGYLVVLDKLAGDQVDLFVNGKCIAKGDVVVIDDNFGVRITEIMQKGGMDAIQPQK